MSTYSSLKSEYEFLNFFRNMVATGECKKDSDFISRQRTRIHSISDKLVDPLAKPLSEDWRHSYSEDGEHGCDYAIFQDEGQTDEEVQDWLDDEVAFTPIYSQYDCTGRAFTTGIHWKRTPVGIVVVHRWALDV